MSQKHSITLNDAEFTLETGKLAKQANASVVVSYGETVVLVTVVGEKENKKGADFFPLSCDYVVKTYSQGRIPKGFIKRETKPSDHEALVSRLIDRPLRPLFPDGFKAEVQILATVLSYDPKHSPESAALTGASAALGISDLPFEFPVAGVFVGLQDGEPVINPSPEVLHHGDLNLFVAGTAEAIAMVEAEANEVDEATMIKALDHAHQTIKKMVKLQEGLRKEHGKTKRVYDLEGLAEDKAEEIRTFAAPLLEKALSNRTKEERYEALSACKKECREKFCSEEGDVETYDLSAVLEAQKSEMMREDILKNNRRVDGRKSDQIRPISCETGILPRTHGSALFTRGETQALAVTTLGSREDEQTVDDPTGNYSKRFYLHYNFPPFCVGEVRRMGPPKRREIGHGKLAERGLFGQIPDQKNFPYTIRLVSEILESNGSSSMATVCSGSLSMLNAGVPLKEMVAGIAMGLVAKDKKQVVLSDILGDEDHIGDMDFKVVGTEKGITALQMDIKVKGLTKKLLEKALGQARKGRLHILKEMKKAVDPNDSKLSPYAPKFIQHKISPHQIKEIIGPGGSVIKSITAKTKARIDVDDSGVVNISSNEQKNALAALKIIQDILKTVQIGEVYDFRVKRITDKGLVVENFNEECSVDFADFPVKKGKNDFKVNDKVRCKVTGYDRRKRIRVSVAV